MKFIGESVGTQINFPHFIIFILLQVSSYREVAAFREPLLVFSENLTRKGGRDTPNISQEKKKSAKPLRRELELYRENGVSLYLNGAPSTPKKIAKACQIAENGVDMRDYTEDEDGHIACVSFDLIRKE